MSAFTRIVAAGLLATAAMSSGSAQTAKPPMLGVWQAEGTIISTWVHQRTLPVTLQIFANDSVSGRIGDATLVSGWFTTRDSASRVGLRWGTDYIVIANLAGPVIRAEGIWRPSVQIPLNWNGNEFVGGLATSGWRVGSADHRTVEANLVLHRVVVADASRRRTRSR